MKKTLIATGLLLAGAMAQAGFVQPAPVVVDFDNRFASGDQTTARFSDDDESFIGCGTRHTLNPGSPDSTFDFGFCQASNADGEQITCFSTESALVDKMRNGGSFGFITFSWVETVDGEGNVSAECTRVGFSTQSFYLPEFTEGDGAFPGRGRGPGN